MAAEISLLPFFCTDIFLKGVVYVKLVDSKKISRSKTWTRYLKKGGAHLLKERQ